MRYRQVNLMETIEGVARMAEAEVNDRFRDILFSARDYLEMFQIDTENKAVAMETILECKKQKGKQK